MAVRDFVDAAGVVWRVWETRPTSRATLNSGYENGWLTFESSGSLRRLTPIPPEWERFSERQLEQLCAAATGASRRGRPERGRRESGPAAPPLAP